MLRRWTERLLTLSPERFAEYIHRAPDSAQCGPGWLLEMPVPRPYPDAVLLTPSHPAA